MSENRLRPIWTPLDAQELARAAAQHEAIPGIPVDQLPRGHRPDVEIVDEPYRLAPGCATLRTPADQRERDEAIMSALHQLDKDADKFYALSGHRPRKAKRIRRSVAVLAGALVLAAGALVAAHRADADPGQCQTEFWPIPFKANTRTICDGPVRPDGSWQRAREFWWPAHYVPARTSCYGSTYVTCTTYGGYPVPRTSQGVEVYDVRPETVLPDEPGHLGGTGVVA